MTYEALRSFCFELSLNYTETQYKEFFDAFTLSGAKGISWHEFDKLVGYCVHKSGSHI